MYPVVYYKQSNGMSWQCGKTFQVIYILYSAIKQYIKKCKVNVHKYNVFIFRQLQGGPLPV